MNFVLQPIRRVWIFFSLPVKPTTVRMLPDLRAEAEDAAKKSKIKGLSEFLASLIQNSLRLEFLDPQNRAFVFSVVSEVGGPWGALEVINALITAVRQEFTAGRLRLGMWNGQVDSVR